MYFGQLISFLTHIPRLEGSCWNTPGTLISRSQILCTSCRSECICNSTCKSPVNTSRKILPIRTFRTPGPLPSPGKCILLPAKSIHLRILCIAQSSCCTFLRKESILECTTHSSSSNCQCSPHKFQSQMWLGRMVSERSLGWCMSCCLKCNLGNIRHRFLWLDWWFCTTDLFVGTFRQIGCRKILMNIFDTHCRSTRYSKCLQL